MALALGLVGQPVQPYLTTGATDFVNSVQKGKEDAIRTEGLKTQSQKSALDLLTAQKKVNESSWATTNATDLKAKADKGQLDAESMARMQEANPEFAKLLGTAQADAVKNFYASNLIGLNSATDQTGFLNGLVQAHDAHNAPLPESVRKDPKLAIQYYKMLLNGAKAFDDKTASMDESGNVITKDALGNYGGFDTGKVLLGGLGATAIAAPFLMGGDEEVEEDVEVMDPAYQTQRARNYYSGAGDAGAGLDFMPQKKYVMQNFYAADGGRAGYANGMLVEDEEEEYIRSGAGQSRRQPKTFLNMGGGAGEAQAEQMLMMEYVKYKNKGGNLSFEQFVQAVMQASQQPEGAGMEQPEAVQMAANGGLMTQVPGYGKEPGTNQFDYPSGGDEVRVGKQEGGIMEAEASEMIDMGGMEKDYRNEGGFVAMGGKERADDVPARLSKNEFVFTADAVRNAGGGDIDKGAEVMENLMSNLEQGGEVSEESQGLEGAQAMYDQQQMLQSRIV